MGIANRKNRCDFGALRRCPAQVLRKSSPTNGILESDICDFLPPLVLTHQGRSTGKNQYW